MAAVAHRVHAGPADLAADLNALISAQGEPFVSTSIYAQYHIFQASRDAGITVTLNGQGADELLAGYDVCLQALLPSYPTQYYNTLYGFLHSWHKLPGRSGSRALQALLLVIAPDQAGLRFMWFSSVFQESWLNVRWLREKM